MRFSTLDTWLDWQISLHPKTIDLGLERVRMVADRLDLLQPKHLVITVAGTNGKGSSVAMLEAILLAAGHRVGAYTSPHIHRYNERIRVAGENVPDEWIVDAFERIDRARGEISLSYFEFGTLAGLLIVAQQKLDIAILEVGLGGRLDAVNILDADLALITSIGVDHTEWLGEGRDQISLEKAGIARPGQPVICSEPNPPMVMKDFLRELGSEYSQLGEAFGYSRGGENWNWWMGGYRFGALPKPGLPGDHQFQNAAGVIAVSQLLPDLLRPKETAIRSGLARVRLTGRCEHIDPRHTSVGFEIILDVAHNPDGIQPLTNLLEKHKVLGKTYVLFGAMRDKNVSDMLKILAPVTDEWLLSNADTERAMASSKVFGLLKSIVPNAHVEVFDSIPAAWEVAKSRLLDQDRLVVAGSFYTVAEVRGLINKGSL
jgi:dihydrofolate synthase/folylpolyglutamate synthase